MLWKPNSFYLSLKIHLRQSLSRGIIPLSRVTCGSLFLFIAIYKCMYVYTAYIHFVIHIIVVLFCNNVILPRIRRFKNLWVKATCCGPIR